MARTGEVSGTSRDRADELPPPIHPVGTPPSDQTGKLIDGEVVAAPGADHESVVDIGPALNTERPFAATGVGPAARANQSDGLSRRRRAVPTPKGSTISPIAENRTRQLNQSRWGGPRW